MKYLFSCRPEFVQDKDADMFADEGEPVIPGFPAPCDNLFISILSFKKAIHAVVTDADVDCDELCARLCVQYPGIPKSLHEAYIYHTARAADAMAPGTRFRLYVTPDKATLHEIGGTERLYHLWEEQPSV